jgi:hypothetical protein
MKTFVAGVVIAISSVLALGGCAASDSGNEIIGPITVELDELQGESVELSLDRVLNINVGDRDVESITVNIEDSKIAEVFEGTDDGSAQFNPGVRPLAVGTTSVTVTSDAGDLDPVSFELVVTE